jgi:alpha-beta hydrolase superfamily lysophospholipase
MRAHGATLRVRMTIAIAAAAGALVALPLAGTADAAKDKGKRAGDEKVEKGPSGLRFYKPPKGYSKTHGDLIWARKAKGLVPLADAKYTKLVLYSSRTPQGQKTAVSGSVSVPKGKPPKGGWPVISYAHGTTGAADLCAPTRNSAGNPAKDYTSYIDPNLNEWLRNGYAVARTDYQGLGTAGPHPYLVGRSEGRGVLDIISAARDLDPRIGKRFLLAGHSQGAHAALFAAGDARTWTPKLKLRGTVAFAPPSHLKEQISLLAAFTDPNPLSALATMILHGTVTQSKAINVNALLSDQALPFYPQLEQVCLAQLGATNSLGGVPPSELIRPGADLTALEAELTKANPLVRSAAPILISQGESDTTVFKLFTDQLEDELVAAGNQVTYRVYPGVDHGGVVVTGGPEALAFFRANLPPR